ncbi:polysaccharide biosynthesis C-terminal domain-containing protein, partial [Lysinibacillus fusiformis]|uniref:polysaccharide biosynthesis C-terminal domain-containing protein n=1 Tax=Lysinibacillus fusiformis TaxID=28031 RepID=UPI0020BED24B
ATLLVSLVLFIVNSVIIYRMIRFTVLGKDTVKMIVSSIVMGAAVGLPTLWLDFTHWSRMLAMGYLPVAIIVGGALYF